MGRMILWPIGLVALILLSIFIWPVMVFASLAASMGDDLLAEMGVLAIGMVIQMAWMICLYGVAVNFGGA